MTQPPENTPPATDPNADELAALRKEKADREAAAQAEKEAEVTELRAYKAEQERKAATAVKAPEKKAEKVTPPETPPTTPPATATTKKRKGLWWPDSE